MARIAACGDHAMERRTFVALVSGGLLAAPFVAEAQPAGKVYRIAYLGNSSAALESELVAAFRQGLRDLNYVEGQNIAIDTAGPRAGTIGSQRSLLKRFSSRSMSS
jgi:hypothetical protein